jgi:hypothetical protein
MKIDRNTLIGGQPAKLVRDLLADASDSGGFYLELADNHLQGVVACDRRRLDRRGPSYCTG